MTEKQTKSAVITSDKSEDELLSSISEIAEKNNKDLVLIERRVIDLFLYNKVNGKHPQVIEYLYYLVDKITKDFSKNDFPYTLHNQFNALVDYHNSTAFQCEAIAILRKIAKDLQCNEDCVKVTFSENRALLTKNYKFEIV